MKTFDVHPLFEFEGGSRTPDQYYTHGHHDPALFAAGLLLDRGCYAPADQVRHEWWRTVPYRSPYRSDAWISLLRECHGPGRGIFPVTVVDGSHTAPVCPWPRESPPAHSVTKPC